MQDFLDTLEQMGIFAELNPGDPTKIRQRFEQHIQDGQLTFRQGVMGKYFAKFFNEPIEFRVKPGAFLYDAETGITHNLDAE